MSESEDFVETSRFQIIMRKFILSPTPMDAQAFLAFVLLCCIGSFFSFLHLKPTPLLQTTKSPKQPLGIFVLGMHHSGTSLLTALLQLVDIGVVTHESAANMMNVTARSSVLQLNPQGFYEPLEMQVINNVLLRNANHTWMSVCRLDARRFEDVERISSRRTLDATQRLITRAYNLAISNSSIGMWAVKDPRLCLTLRFWLTVTNTNSTERVCCIILYRPATEVAQSMIRYHRLDFFTGLALWEAYLVNTINSCKHLPSSIVRYMDLLRDPVTEMERLLAWLHGRHLFIVSDAQKGPLRKFTAKNLRHSTANISTEIWPELRELDGVLSVGGGDVLKRAWTILWMPRNGLHVSSTAERQLCMISPYRRPWLPGIADAETNVTLSDIYGPSEVPKETLLPLA